MGIQNKNREQTMKLLGRMRRNLPNALSMARIALTIPLIWLRPLSAGFFVLYALAGVTDAMDGCLARAWRVTSKLGAKLDGAGDFLLFSVLLYRLIPIFPWPLWTIVWIAVIAAIRLSALFVCYIRFRQFAFLHTYANKVTGFLLFLFPFLIVLLDLNATATVLCAVASLSSLEELCIQIRSDKFDLNLRSMFHPPSRRDQSTI